MKAFTVERYGDKAGVRAGEVPDPQVGADDVLVRIRAASVNPLDRMIRDGEMKSILPYRVPFVLGNAGQRPGRSGGRSRCGRYAVRGGRRGLRAARQGPDRS